MKTYALIFFVIVASVVFATPSSIVHARQTITMEQAIVSATQSNPSIMAADQSAAAAHARPPQAASPPDPNFMVQFGQVPINTTDIDQGTKTYMIQQQIPFPSKLVYGYKAEKRAAEASDEHRNMTAQEIVRRVKLAYLNAYRLQEEARVERSALAILRTNKASAEQAYAVDDDATLADPLRAAVDMGDVEGRLATIEQERIEALAALSHLMARPLDPETRVASPKKPGNVASLDRLIERAKVARPEIAEAQKLIQSQGARVSLAKSQYGPDLTLRWGYNDIPHQRDAWTGRIMISVPLWALSKQRFGVRESQALLKRAQTLSEKTTLITESEVKSAHARYRAASKRIDVFARKVVPRAKAYLAATKEAYSAGSEAFTDVVEGIMKLRHAEIQLIRARIDHQRAHADLERAVGSSPSREGS